MIETMKKAGKLTFVLTIKNGIQVSQEFFNQNEKKIVVIGSSSIDKYEHVKNGIESLLKFKNIKFKELITKRDQTTDTFAQKWANENNVKIKYFESKAETETYRIQRNMDMGSYCDLIFAIWNGKPKGGIVDSVVWAKKNSVSILIYNILNQEIKENEL